MELCVFERKYIGIFRRNDFAQLENWIYRFYYYDYYISIYFLILTLFKFSYNF